MELPGWADKELSSRLLEWISSGEGQEVEFKSEFPTQAHNLATEVAAFATCGGGAILLGVENNGRVVGLPAANEDERDQLIRRAQGIARNVRPQVRLLVGAASYEGLLVLVVAIPRQDEPVYYYEFRPYLRDGRVSRPAEPDEVKQLIWAHPSSHHKRRTEELEYELMRRQVEQSNRQQQAFIELNERADRALVKRLYGE